MLVGKWISWDISRSTHEGLSQYFIGVTNYIRPSLLVIEDNAKRCRTSQLTRRINHWNSWPRCPLRFWLPGFFLTNSLVVSGESSWQWYFSWLANWSW